MLHTLLTAALATVRFSPEEAARGLAAHERTRQASSANLGAIPSCEIDFRDRMPACKQQGADRCWATGVAEFGFFYNKTSIAAGDTCSTTECAVVSVDMHTECCPYSAHKGCGADGQDVAHIVATAGKYVGRGFRSLGQPPTEQDLVAHLMAGRPLMPIIMWPKGGGHALMVAGCKASSGWGGNKYYLHDPERDYYEEVSYMRLMDYSAFQTGKWTDTVLIDERRGPEAHAEAAQKAARVALPDGVSVTPAQRQMALATPTAPVEAAPRKAPRCDADMRDQLHQCRQATLSWCWATSIGLLAYYYNVSDIGTTPCSTLECEVVGFDLGRQCCPAHADRTCDGHGAKNSREIAQVATNFTRRPFIAHDQSQPGQPPLSEDAVVAMLSAGHPLLRLVMYTGTGGGHAEVIGGCSSTGLGGSNLYYVMDPMAGRWTEYGWSTLQGNDMETWFSTVYATSGAGLVRK